MKTVIEVQNKKVPVYFEEKSKKALDKLIEVINLKIKTGKRTVTKFLNSLDSIEIVGSDAILYSSKETDTLALSLY
ncbi:hypothetical protein SY83_19685 [Paenibacillus swuensis]|uniref:Uncharacterized protein n=1 Tax=Paenibacillus swuensis TaxID=1178515 RepID=A0A172TM70_9BACL|nr:hypothetical protein [Paenibacillus swuensis]ANE48141.1 hypothetical protein SY83_19685 [Paenibacillus swuensis]